MAKKKQKIEVFDPTKNSENIEGTVTGLYKEWFLDYASYVILERAVPYIDDGLKPVQRRILHALKQMDDGRFHKVANVIGQTMSYHPHGDASIGDALVKLGQKKLLIDTQGNWGDARTGDSAAASRYIEARLTKFALEIAFNAQTTDWQVSYDGRKKEPINLPVKFPLLLAQGAEGIAVGLSTKILPHNFNELIDASIKHLQGKKFKIYPDFETGGSIDIDNYNDGKRGGKVKVRATIEITDKKTLTITEIPFGTTTGNLMDSIVKANEKGKIKIKKVTDQTAKNVSIVVELAPGTSPEITKDALYAFTDCELSISPNACVVIDDKPHFTTVTEILKWNTENTKALLKKELEIKKNELEEKWHFSSLEKIFIENRIYRRIEEAETWEEVLEEIKVGLKPHIKKLKRKVTEEDIVRLTEIRIKRISKYNKFKADEIIAKIEEELKQVKYDLKHLTDYAIAYYQRLKEKYGKGRERKTKLANFENIEIKQVAAANAKLYVDRKDGFVGKGLKKFEFVCDCSDVDDIIAIKKDGTCMITRLGDKKFVGKDILHVAVWKKNDERTVYNMIYASPKAGKSYVKRFNVIGITRDKDYSLVKKDPKAKVVYLTANANGESELIKIDLSPNCTARIKQFEYDFASIEIKGKLSGGNTLTKYPIKKVTQLSKGKSTLGGIKVWYDGTTGRINADERGYLLGTFDTNDLILAVYNSGEYEIRNFDFSNRFKPEEVVILQKLNTDLVLSSVYYDGETKLHFIKRFKIETTTLDKRFLFISEANNSKLKFVTINDLAFITFTETNAKTKKKENKKVILSEFIDIKGWKSKGNKLTNNKITALKIQEPENNQLTIGDELEWDV